MQDAREIAALCALRASEAEACAALAIPISSWHHFKARSRNSEAYQEMMDALRGAKIQAHMENIEKFSEKDFRASVAYLEKILPQRFGRDAAPAPPPSFEPIHVAVILAAARSVYGVKDAKAVPVKQLPAPSGKLPAMFPNENHE